MTEGVGAQGIGPQGRRGGLEVRQWGAGGRTGGSLAARDGPPSRGGHAPSPQKGLETREGTTESPVAKSRIGVCSQRPALRVQELQLRLLHRRSPGSGRRSWERMTGVSRVTQPAHSPWGQLFPQNPPSRRLRTNSAQIHLVSRS